MLMFDFAAVVETVVGWVWSPALVALCLGAGLYFSIRTRFVQVRHFGEMFRLLFHTDKSQKVGISSFQAFAVALSGRVGTGNIVGVATAIGYGGPGAIVWMWIIAFLGAGSAYAEATLSQIYKEEHAGQFRGGPSYYIEKGLHSKPFAILFACCALLACGLFMPPVQSNGIALSFAGTFSLPPALIGAGVALLIALVVIGGVKRIAGVAAVVAPFMAILYVLLSIVILVFNAPAVPGALADMFRSAIGTHELFGGILGSAVAWGVKRGIYSNEAGQGTGAIVAGAAKVRHPVRQGLVQAFSVYVDTLLVCTATAVMILATHTYQVVDGSGRPLCSASVEGLGEPGVGYTTAAVSTLIGPSAAGILISVALLCFAFTTIMAYYYYAETSLVYLLGKGRREKMALWVLRFAVVASVFFGSLKEAKAVWCLGDIGVGAMAWINIIAILLLSGKPVKALRMYERQQKEGKVPHFDPDELGISGADYWKENNKQNNP